MGLNTDARHRSHQSMRLFGHVFACVASLTIRSKYGAGFGLPASSGIVNACFIHAESYAQNVHVPAEERRLRARKLSIIVGPFVKGFLQYSA